MTWRAALVLVALVVAVTASAGRPLGEDIFHNAKPPCVACHNERSGNLAYSRMPPGEMAHWITNGIDDRMPGYRLTNHQMDALIDYLLWLRKSAR